MTYERLDKRAETIRTKLRVRQVQSDMALQQKQREANRAELQAVVQEQLRTHSGRLNTRSPPPPPSTSDLQRPDGMKYMTARKKRDMVMAQHHRMLICAGINVSEAGFSGWLFVLQVIRAIQHTLNRVGEH
jgi:outer membrane protein TolC